LQVVEVELTEQQLLENQEKQQQQLGHVDVLEKSLMGHCHHCANLNLEVLTQQVLFVYQNKFVQIDCDKNFKNK